MRKLVYDIKLGKPGCALLQAAMGGDFLHLGVDFPAESWLVYPTPNMKVYELTDDEYVKAVELTRRVLTGQDVKEAMKEIENG